MQVSKWGALTGALVVVAGMAPASVVRAQEREPVVRAIQVIGHARIGVTVRDPDPADAKDPKAGVVIDVVSPGGAADKAGMKVGDAITEFDGERVRSTRQFTRLVQETSNGRAVTAALSRGGQRLTVTVTPDRTDVSDDFRMRLLDTVRVRPSIAPPIPPPAPRAPRALVTPMPFDFGVRGRNSGRLGITIEDVDAQLADYFGVKEGVLVKSVSEGSVAAKAGLKAGDVVTSFNGRHIYDSSDLTRALDRMENDGEFTVEVMRDHKAQTLKGKLEVREERMRVRSETND